MVFFFRSQGKRRVSILTIRKAEILWTSLSVTIQHVGIADLTVFLDCISLKVPFFKLAFAKCVSLIIQVIFFIVELPMRDEQHTGHCCKY